MVGFVVKTYCNTNWLPQWDPGIESNQLSGLLKRSTTGCTVSTAMVLVDNEVFLNQLSVLFSKTKIQGTVFITMKQYHGETKPKPRNLKSTDPNPHACGEPRCLFRATNGKKKFSTVVMHKDVNKFQQAYGTVLKANIDNLKKRDKAKKSKKAKATQ